MNKEEIHNMLDNVIAGKKNDECIEILEEFISFSECLLESFGVSQE